MTIHLESPKELAERVGVPISNVRYLIREDMLDHIYTAPGRRNPKIPAGAWERYIEKFTIRADETKLATASK
ncbi:hypothetical protein [Epibacterium ulvae]|uniref:hypothetical protein n=1 Tax=Epibacterium ulvae TaxID=1156985 RepID=UPI00249383F9|nr:hypothetical protein [Epibacterium ulvae]